MYMRLFLLFLFVFSFFSCHNNNIAKLPPSDDKEKRHPPKVSKPLQTQSIALPIHRVDENLIKSSDVNINSLPATVNGIQTSQISFRISGYLSEVLVKNGQYVKKGQIIARLDNSIVLQNLNLAKLALEQANTAQHFAELTLKRTQTLNQRQATTQIALEQAELTFQNAQISFKQAQANLKLAQINYDETTLISPFEGYLFGLTAWVGTYVSSTTIIATLTSVNEMQIQIPVPQTLPNTFKIGQKFSFSNATQNMSGVLKITGVVPYVDANTKTYLLFATVEKINGQLMAGELVVVNLK